MPEARPAFQFAELEQQHDTAQLGMWVFLGTEVLFFGGLILAYSVYRSADPGGFAEAARHTRILIGTLNTGILLTSSFLVAWAVAIVPRCEARAGAMLLGVAALLGCVFLALKGVEYRLEYDEGLVPGRHFALSGAHAASLFFAFYFVATGLHAVHVAIGVGVLAVIAVKTRALAFSERYHVPVTVAGLYWHFVDLVWVVLFALIYLPGRSS